MVKSERWGKKYKDQRDWKGYSEELVVRGEFLLELDWVKSWNTELIEMNFGKRGAAYRFPESLIKLQAIWNQWVDVRGVEGITRKLQEFDLIPKHNDFSTINRRVNQIEAEIILPQKGTISVSTDGSGMKMTNRGDYKETKYGRKRKKFARVVITADPLQKKLLKVDVFIDGEGPSEPEVAMSHLEELIKQGFDIEKFWGDGAFDVHDLFDLLDQYDIKSAIKIRKNAVLDPSGSLRRKIEVIKYRKKRYKKWAKDTEYGKRWVGTEGVFSAVKRKFAENTRSKRVDHLCHEIKRKFWAYDQMTEYGKRRVQA